MAVTIGRTARTDDDGSGTTGTVLNNAEKTSLYDEIDTALALLLPLAGGTITGTLTISGFGTHAFSGGGTGDNNLIVRNTTSGTGNSASVYVGNNSTAFLLAIQSFSSAYTPSGPYLASGSVIEQNGAGGISIVASNAAGVVRVYSGGTTEVGRWDLTSSLQIGGTAARSGTAGTKRLDIFDGTAPVGTLANGCSFYSTSGEMRVMDAAGNATLLSPHDHGPDWVFLCENRVTGKRVRIEVEKLLKRLNDCFGEREWFQEAA